MPKDRKSRTVDEIKKDLDVSVKEITDDDLDTIDLNFFELFEVLNPKEIIKLLNSIGGSFTPAEGLAIKKLVDFLNNLDDEKIDDLMDAFDKIINGV